VSSGVGWSYIKVWEDWPGLSSIFIKNVYTRIWLCCLFITLYWILLFRRNVARIGSEARLYSSLVAAIFFPIGITFCHTPLLHKPYIVISGCFIYAWTAIPSISSWIGPMIGIFIFTTSLFIIYLTVFTYLADTYSIYASSALAGQSLSRKHRSLKLWN